ncbi:hypothetical protein [Pseudoxanthomonas mexicana]
MMLVHVFAFFVCLACGFMIGVGIVRIVTWSHRRASHSRVDEAGWGR